MIYFPAIYNRQATLMNLPDIRVNAQRLHSTLDAINAFGRNPVTGGCNRASYSPADMDARAWLAGVMKADGLRVRIDAVGNVIGRYGPADGPCVMTGSHLDTVPEGGAWDGALGVAAALESVRAMIDIGHVPHQAIEVVATAEEEGRFGGMLGAQAIAGVVDSTWFDNAQDASGRKLRDALREAGLAPERIADAARAPHEVSAWLELHIEQGPVLERTGVPIGIVEAISGVASVRIALQGRANHAGTTPMDMRADALVGAARVIAAIDTLIERNGTPNSRVTAGSLTLTPNFAHTIAGRAEFTVIVRDTEAQVMDQLCDGLQALVSATAAAHVLQPTTKVTSRLDPVALDGDLVALARAQADAAGMQACVMASGAGHDAQVLQSICPAVMLFVPSRGGLSHAPGESTSWAHAEMGATLLARLLVQAAQR